MRTFEDRKDWCLINGSRNKIFNTTNFKDGSGHLAIIHPESKDFRPDCVIFFEDRDSMQTAWIAITQALGGKLLKEYDQEAIKIHLEKTSNIDPGQIPADLDFESPGKKYFENICVQILTGDFEKETEIT